MLLSVFLADAGNDLKFGIQPSRGKNDVQIGGISSCGRDQTSCALDVRLAQSLFLRCVADEHQPLIAVTRRLGLVVIDDHERRWPTRELACGTASNTASATNNVMIA